MITANEWSTSDVSILRVVVVVVVVEVMLKGDVVVGAIVEVSDAVTHI